MPPFMKAQKKRFWDLLGFGVLCVWLVMMGILVKKTYFPTSTDQLSGLDVNVLVEGSETWMAIYHHDEKIGYTHSQLTKQSQGFTVVERAVMNLHVAGSVHRIATEISGHLNEDASLRSFAFVLASGLVRFEARGKVEGKSLLLKYGFGHDLREHTVLLQEPPFLSAGLLPRLMKEGLSVGARYRVAVFDPSSMSQRPIDVEVVGRESVLLDEVTWDAVKVKTTFKGIELYTWIGPNGERLKEEGLMGLTLIMTTERKALSGVRPYPEIDMAEEVSVASNRVLDDPSRLTYLKLRLAGGDLKGLDIDGGRQQVRDSLLEIFLERAPLSIKPSLAKKHDGLGNYLRPEPMVQSDHASIKEQAREIVGSVTEPELKARRILEWVYQSLDKRSTVSVPNALGTLQQKAGDCNEHAVLFAALLRAEDIPSKLCAGLVYTRGRFYYHAWNEVFLGRWITADSLMGQMPADVAHVRLVEGGPERQVELVGVIGLIGLDILDAR